MSQAVRVVVPATSANLGPGFDSFGLALGWYDEVVARPLQEQGLRITVEGEGGSDVPLDERHLVARATLATFDRLGWRPDGLALACRNRIPHGRGLGSSAAAIVAGVLAARALAPGGEALDDRSALAFAAGLEGHPDNVAACLLGGLTIAWAGGSGSEAGFQAVRVEPGPVELVAFVPDEPVATELARGLLPDTVPHHDAAANAARAGLLVAALTAGSADVELLLAATEDRLHQRFRAPAMPASADLVTGLRERGVPAVVSGAGPTVLAFTTPDNGKALVDAVADVVPTVFRAHVLPVDRTGAEITVGTLE